MNRSIHISVTLIVLLMAAPLSYGQTTVWLSDNATFQDLDLTTAAPPGTTGSFDIWIKTEQPSHISGVSLDLMSIGGAIELTGADIVIGQDRFTAYANPIVESNGARITDVSAAVFFDWDTGIGPSEPVDNEALGAYQFATIHYRVVGQGTSELQLKVGGWLFGDLLSDTLHLGINDPVTQNVLGATDTIIDGRMRVVPEPGSLLLLLVGGLSLLVRRLRCTKSNSSQLLSGN